jgi:1-acyl-sn-glycerol-3-phosphate acyltransferase
MLELMVLEVTNRYLHLRIKRLLWMRAYIKIKCTMISSCFSRQFSVTGISVAPKKLYVLHSLPNVSAKCVVLFLRWEEVPASNLDFEIAYPD